MDGKGQEANWLARAPIIDDSAGVIAAAEEGIGFALARWSLVQRSLEQGRVVLAGDALLPFRFSYFFVCPEPYLVMPKVKRFRDWIFDMAKTFPKPHDLFDEARCRVQGRGHTYSRDSLSFLDAGFRHRVC